ncbi:hypothetical protein JBL43_08120 [Aureibaculum sp. A20]|uniref:Transglutaminase-like domain-containing protein n=1 Tax=Aureibaculum flavum TaxID=2795986 RepID=A0ABS0WQI5_9FLAO|nr:transglutaminase domain-containing protein [Aureibaculum flavum]MBJ2174199.1 hypothetical protein [Aureibaculum flavum]
MRNITLYLLLFLFINKNYAQQFDIAGQMNNIHSPITSTKTMTHEYDAVDARVRSYSSDYKSSAALAEQILKDFTTKKDRIRALYTWLCITIKYDMTSYAKGQTEIGFSYTSKTDFNRKMKAINNSIVHKTLETKKAICEGYAQTFKEVSEYLGIECKLIGGYAKGDVSDINTIPEAENHAWNAVRIDEKWYLIDATWGAGYTYGNKWFSQFDDFYFFSDPDQFALTHYPSETEWLLTESKLTLKQFYSKPIYKNSFFLNKLKLISPKFGVLEEATKTDIVFLMGHLPENINLFYAFKGDRYSKKIEPDCNSDQCTFNISFTKTSDSELYIFVNQRPILEYFVKLK